MTKETMLHLSDANKRLLNILADIGFLSDDDQKAIVYITGFVSMELMKPIGIRDVQVHEKNGDVTVFQTNAPDDLIEKSFHDFDENPLDVGEDEGVYDFVERVITQLGYFIDRPIFDVLYIEE